MKGRATTSQTWLALKTEHVHIYFKSQPFIESHHLTPNAVIFLGFFLQNGPFRPLNSLKLIKRAQK